MRSDIQVRANYSAFMPQFGVGTDIPVPGDFDGDRKTDVAISASTGTWFILRSSTNFDLSCMGKRAATAVLHRP
jgi:hypothetical protein